MLDVLLYANLSCIDANALMDKIRKDTQLSDALRTELIEVVRDASEDCIWDAND
tara:strand:- start:199 stop:360 length:162 start_codon:yes stop_codon:yes gene_type:complete